MTSSDSEMDDHKSYHDDPPTYEETMAGIIPPPPDEISPPRRSESSASETSTARPGINRSYWRLDTDPVIFKVSSWIPEQTKAKKSRNKRFDISDYYDSSVILFRMDSCTRSTICSLKKIQLKKIKLIHIQIQFYFNSQNHLFNVNQQKLYSTRSSRTV